jgi:hypothetical protein
MAGATTENNMADAFNLSQLGNLPPELYEQQQALNRQQQMAAMLMQQSQQTPQGQMISGRYVAPSFTQNLAGLAQAGVGAYLQNKGDKQALELANRLREGKLGTQQALMEALNAGDTKKALAIATADQYGAGTQFIPALIGSVIPKTPEKVAEYNIAKAEGFKGTLNDYLQQMTPYQKEQIGIERQKLGMEQQKLANELGGGKLNEGQGLATGFGMRAKEANQIATGLEKQGINIPGKTSTVVSGIAGMTPFVGEKYAEATKSLFNVLPEFAGGLSPGQQQNAQARRNFISAVLRKESGAAISPQEYTSEEKKYFPQLGDSDAVIKQKQDARNSAIQALEIQAGPGARLIKQTNAPVKVVNFNDLP